MKFSHSFIVNSTHLDEKNHVNNVVYVQWIQDVAVAHWRNIVSQDIQTKYSWILLKHEIDYKQQSFENDEITATTWVGKATKVTCERFTEIKRGETLLVKAKSLWCMIDFDNKKPAKINDEIRQKFGME
jgi:acyl-CoA thioester hydrolase